MRNKRLELMVLCAICVLLGCSSIQKAVDLYSDVNERIEEYDAKYGDFWKKTAEKLSPSKPDDAPVAPVSVDGVEFALLKWKYGGPPLASGAVLSTPRIANLSCKGNTLYYSWEVGLSGWGLGHTDAGAIAAAFVQLDDGSWVGGKFDWVSTSRDLRGLQHLVDGYNGWSLANVPNPCQIAFVVVTANGSKRSNVAGPVTWKR